jgi:S-adenosyl methyltransferase
MLFPARNRGVLEDNRGMATDGEFRPDIPSTARMYDYYLGGKDNYPADREAADHEQRAPSRPVAGAGQPRRLRGPRPDRDRARPRPAARVAGNRILEHDARSPEAILGDPGLTSLLDLTRPVAVLLVAVLHFIAGSHAKADEADVYDQATSSLYCRTRERVTEMFRGCDLVEPGVVWTPQWRPDGETGRVGPPGRSLFWCGFARRLSPGGRLTIPQMLALAVNLLALQRPVRGQRRATWAARRSLAVATRRTSVSEPRTTRSRPLGPH